MVFNGTTDTLDLGNPSALSQSLSSFSATAWVRLDKDLGSEIKNHVILGNKDGTQGGFYLYLQDHTTPTQAGRLRITCYNGGSSDTLASTGHHYLADRDWHHVAFTLEGGIGKLYVDGLQVFQATITPPGDSSNAMVLGSLLGSSNHWPGAMDEVQFYRRSLKAEEIQSDYLTWAPDSHKQSVTDQGLTAQWDFDDTYQNAIDPNNPAVAYGTVNFTEAKQNQGLQLVQDATVDLGTGADVTLDNGTITLWVKMDTDQLGTTNSRYVLLANHDGDEGFRLAIDDDTDPAQAGSIQFTCYTDTTVNALTSGTTKWPDDQNWHHLAVTKEGTHAKMYLDGVLISTTDILVTPAYESGPLPLRIGATGEGTAYPWKGAIDQLKIFTEPLSPYDILGTYLEGDPVFTEDASRGGVEEARFILFASDTDPFGLQLRESYHPNHENPEPHGFTGQEKEPDFGLYYYGGRWYFRELGRFLQVDPAREFWNSYSYVGNNPILFVDPTGEFGENMDRLNRARDEAWENGEHVKLFALSLIWFAAHATGVSVADDLSEDLQNMELPSTETLVEAEILIFTAGAGSLYSRGYKAAVPPAAEISTMNAGRFADDVVSNPKSLWGKSAEDIQRAFQEGGYEAVIEQSTKGSRLSVQVRIKGHPEISNIQVHPGGGRHGGAYYKVSTSAQGKIKIVDQATYKPTPGEKATIIEIVD